MNDADVSKRIQQMVRFIRQEAEEKANEISVSAEEEFNVEKLQLVEANNRKIRQEHECKEKQVEIRRKMEVDRALVESILNDAKQEYADKAEVHPLNITIDDVYLPSPPTHNEAHGTFCSGGVVLASKDGKIVCENTLDARLEVVFRQKLPEIRKHLFGKMEA